MKITFVNQTAEKINPKRLQKTLDLSLLALQEMRVRGKKNLLTKKEIVFVFLTAKQMQKVNNQFRCKDKPTDVLSFYSEDKMCVGELLFCLPVLKKQAKQQGHLLELELMVMMIHGLLHLLGYDHEISKTEEQLMFRIQNSCFMQVRHQLS